jgi:hypothetical protein
MQFLDVPHPPMVRRRLLLRERLRCVMASAGQGVGPSSWSRGETLGWGCSVGSGPAADSSLEGRGQLAICSASMAEGVEAWRAARWMNSSFDIGLWLASRNVVMVSLGGVFIAGIG